MKRDHRRRSSRRHHRCVRSCHPQGVLVALDWTDFDDEETFRDTKDLHFGMGL